jgi:hypothetical protein
MKEVTTEGGKGMETDDGEKVEKKRKKRREEEGKGKRKGWREMK